MLTGGAAAKGEAEDWFDLAVQASIYCASERRNQGRCGPAFESNDQEAERIVDWLEKRKRDSQPPSPNHRERKHIYRVTRQDGKNLPLT